MKSIFSLLFLAFTFLPNISCTSISKGGLHDDKESRAVWLSFPYWNMKTQKKKILARYLADKNVNTVYLAVYGSGIARWPSKALKESGLVRETKSNEEFAQGVNILREEGIKVVAWFENGLSVYLFTDFAKKRPNLLLNCDGKINSGEHGGTVMAFMDTSNPKGMAPLYAALKELARHPLNFTEIQLDRYRYTISTKGNMCKTKDDTSNPTHINNAIKNSYKAIKEVNPNITVSATPIGSYGYWKFHQRWGNWVQGGYIDAIVSQAYIVPFKLDSCKRGAPSDKSRKLTESVFKLEFATLSGKPDLLEEAIDEIKTLKGPISDLDFKKRRYIAKLRRQQFRDSNFTLRIGYRAHVHDDSECVLDQMKVARDNGVSHASLWVSQVEPSYSGAPHPTIDDNLSLLYDTIWHD